MPVATTTRLSLAELNRLSREDFVAHLGNVLEHSPHFTARVAERRPFVSIEQLNAAFVESVQQASSQEQLSLLNAHPDLADRLVRLTAASTHEQASAGLDALTPQELAEFQQRNQAYRERFAFPFIICARLNSKDAILAAFRARQGNSPEVELQTALVEVGKIAGLRIADLVSEG